MLITVAELEEKVLTSIRLLGYQDEEAQRSRHAREKRSVTGGDTMRRHIWKGLGSEASMIPPTSGWPPGRARDTRSR